MKLINVKGGKYAKVVDRLRKFKEENPDHEILTEYAIHSDRVVFQARIRREKDSPWFVGHSCGSLSGAKTFEKTETIAVGRALAFAGYYADGEIASYEEVEDIPTTNEYMNTLFKLENMIDQVERIVGDHEEVEKIKRNLDDLSVDRMRDAMRYLKVNFLDESLKADKGRVKRKDVTKEIKAELDNEYHGGMATVQSKMNES